MPKKKSVAGTDESHEPMATAIAGFAIFMPG
jgi:hypothetical protein